MDDMPNQLPNFDKKSRSFRFNDGDERVDLGRCSAYWTMVDGRPMISEHTTDRDGNIVETYFFAKNGLEDQSPDTLFSSVKAAHKSYEHDPSIEFSAFTTVDDNDMALWAVDVLIANKRHVIRERPPFFKFYGDWQLPLTPWPVLQDYRQAQWAGNSFLVIEGETGSASWRDSDIYKLVPAKDEQSLNAQLNKYPCKMPKEDYANFNFAVIDARDSEQPFNQSVCFRAADWPLT